MTTQPISGNQFFTQVVDQASQLPSLDVAELQSGATAVNSLAVSSSSAATDIDSNGHVIKSQKTAPVVSLSPGWAPDATISFAGPATDTSGIIRVTRGTSVITTEPIVITLTFNKPFPSGSSVQVMITNANKGSMIAEGGGFLPFFYCTGTETGFTLNIYNTQDPTTIQPGALVDYAYSVVATVPM